MPTTLEHLLWLGLALCAYSAFVLIACATERHWTGLSGRAATCRTAAGGACGSRPGHW